MTRDNALVRVLNWLRSGYPAGIPQTDYLPLLEVLHRALTPGEVTSIAAELAARAADGVRIDEDDIRTMISARAFETATDDDVRRVSAALAQTGWPLAGIDDRRASEAKGADATDRAVEADAAGGADVIAAPVSAADNGSDAGVVSRIVGWLREGYPAGVPEQDYVPLLALLQRRLTKEEVKTVARSLRRAEVSPAGPDDIAAAIERLIQTSPSQEDLHRVKDRLAKKGWPLDFPDPDAPVRPHLVRS